MIDAVARIVSMALAREGARQACALDVEAIEAAAEDPDVAFAHARADLVVAAWRPLAWGRATPFVTAAELFWGVVHASATVGLRLFFLGAPVGAPARAERVVSYYVPGARVVGTYAPRLERVDWPKERERIAFVVRAAEPDVLVVALGDAREDAWIARNKSALGVPVSMGLRGFFSGRPARSWPRAPATLTAALRGGRVRA